MIRKIYTIFMAFVGLFLLLAQPVYSFTSVSATDAYNALSSDSTAVMFDTRTVDEHNHQKPPWQGLDLDTTAPAGTAIWTVDGVNKLPITVPYWSAGLSRVVPGPPEEEEQIRNIIEGLLSAGVIDFDSPIYLICRTAYRSYYMAEWMDTQTFTNASTDVTGSFTNLINIDSDPDPGNAQGGMKEWNVSALPIFNGTIVPPQIFSGYPDDGYIETQTNDVIFAVGVLEPTTGGFITPVVTDVSLYVDGDTPVVMTPVDEATLRLLFGIPADVYIPGTVYTATQNLASGLHAWNSSATNSFGTSWNLHVLDATVQGPDGPGVRTLTVDIPSACTDNDADGFAIEGGDCGEIDCDDNDSSINPGADDIICDGMDNDCDGLVDEDYVSAQTTCGTGECIAFGETVCAGGGEIDTCTPGAPIDEICDDGLDNDCDGLTDAFDSDCVGVCIPTGDETICDGVDNDCDGLIDEDYVPAETTCGIGECESTGQLECVSGSEVDTCVEGTPGTEGSGDETCSDSLDNDCDGLTDYSDPDCAIVVCTDNDDDGYSVEGGDCGAIDCDDNDSGVNPGATEGPAGDPTCEDSIDNDCDGRIDLYDWDCYEVGGRRMHHRAHRGSHGGRRS